MMNKAIFFSATKSYHGNDDEPVVMAGVLCRFRKNRVYEIETRGNDALIAELEKEHATGGIKMLSLVEAIPILEAQEATDRRLREVGKTSIIGGGKTAAKVEV